MLEGIIKIKQGYLPYICHLELCIFYDIVLAFYDAFTIYCCLTIINKLSQSLSLLMEAPHFEN